MNKQQSVIISTYLSLSFLSCFGLYLWEKIEPVTAQVISDQTTGTVINQNQNQINITGGVLSSDQTNLFHSFQQFNLTSEQIANFLATPQLENILGRITGGGPSYLNGLIQVIGGNANLYLMNPAGLIFGNNFQLNVPSDFIGTTATAITFGNQYFNAFGNNNYGDLIGNPTGFVFNTNNPGAIINEGDLSLTDGSNLMLIGGQVINSGNLTVKEGNITLISGSGESKIILAQPGQILNLEINLPPEQLGNAMAITPLDLPELLTGNNQINLTGLNVNPDRTITTANGTLIPTNAGTTIVTGNINTSSDTGVGGNIYVLGKTIGILDQTQISTDGLTGGGNIYIGGEYLGGGSLPTAHTTIIDTQTLISADALTDGDGGNIIVWSDYYTNFLGTISAKGGKNSGNGGFVETSSKDILNAFGSVNASAENGSPGQWLLDPRNVIINDTGTGSLVGGTFTPTTDDAQISVGTILAALNSGTSVTITTGTTGTQAGNITVNSAILPTVSINDVTLTLDAANNITVNQSIDSSGSLARVNIILLAGNSIDVNANIVSNAGDITLISSNGNIDTTGIVLNSSPNSSSLFTTGGNITLTALNGAINTGDLLAYSAPLSSPTDAQGGNVTVRAGQSIVTGNIQTYAFANYNTKGGDVILQAGSGPSHNIAFSTIDTTSSSYFATGLGGNVTITANGGTVRGTGTIGVTGTDTIDTRGSSQGGTINITHDGGPNNDPFIVGDSTINGTRGAIITGTFSNIIAFNNTSLPVQPNGGADTIGNSSTNETITITSRNTPPVLSSDSSSTTDLTNISGSFSISSLNLIPSDINSDNLSYIITVVNGSITVNGITYTAGQTVTVSSSDLITYTAPEGLFGDFVALQVVANDVVSNSNIIALNYQQTPPSNGSTDGGSTDGGSTDGGTTDNYNSEQVERINTNPEVITTPPTTFQLPTLDRSREILQEIVEETGVKPAIIYVSFAPSLTTNPQFSASKQNTKNEEETDSKLPENQSLDQRFAQIERVNSQEFHNHLNLPQNLDDIALKIQPQPTDELELILITPGQTPIRKTVAGVTRADVLRLGQQLQANVTNYRRANSFLAPARSLYQLIITPLEATLEAQEIENLVFIMDVGLRSLPLAVLYDGEQYLVEKYSVGFMPSLSLTDTRYVDVKNLKVLAMGADTFTSQNPLPSVPIELANIEHIWGAQTFLNQDFTEENLKKARNNTPFGIIHLATHGEFLPGNLNNSYIQFFDQRLTLDQIRELRLNQPPVELMVLSACRTALGDENAELGFAGFATQAGVKTVLGSLWYVSDEGTLALMTNFYDQLKTAPIKAEALRQAQIAMIKGNFTIPEMLEDSTIDFNNIDLSHPYYWSGFTMVGSPW